MSFFCPVGQGGKSGAVVHGDVSQNLPVQLDSGPLQTVDELAVADSHFPAGGINAHNPKRTEIALLEPTAHISVTERLFNRFLGGAVQLGFGEKVPLRTAQGLVAIVSPVGTSFYSWHVFPFI